MKILSRGCDVPVRPSGEDELRCYYNGIEMRLYLTINPLCANLFYRSKDYDDRQKR